MNKHSWRFAMALLAIAMCIGFCSCGDSQIEEVEEEEIVDPISTVAITYTLNLDWTWFDYFDLSVVYTNGLGEQETADLDFVSWRYYSNLPAEDATKKIEFQLLATPKPNLPEFEDDQIYTGAFVFLMDIRGYREDGSEKRSYGQVTSMINSDVYDGCYFKRKLKSGDGVYCPISTTAYSRDYVEK